jgi:hypothetical protein
MNLFQFQIQLRANPGAKVAIILPSGQLIPAHYHVTEVGHVAKKFIDCGGTMRVSEACVLQTWTGSPGDDGHRLTGEKLAKILALAKSILPETDLPVEIEHEDGFVSQFPVETIQRVGAELQLRLGVKHTDCLAKERCGAEPDENCCAPTAGSERCCG